MKTNRSWPLLAVLLFAGAAGCATPPPVAPASGERIVYDAPSTGSHIPRKVKVNDPLSAISPSPTTTIEGDRARDIINGTGVVVPDRGL